MKRSIAAAAAVNAAFYVGWAFIAWDWAWPAGAGDWTIQERAQSVITWLVFAGFPSAGFLLEAALRK